MVTGFIFVFQFKISFLLAIKKVSNRAPMLHGKTPSSGCFDSTKREALCFRDDFDFLSNGGELIVLCTIGQWVGSDFSINYCRLGVSYA